MHFVPGRPSAIGLSVLESWFRSPLTARLNRRRCFRTPDRTLSDGEYRVKLLRSIPGRQISRLKRPVRSGPLLLNRYVGLRDRICVHCSGTVSRQGYGDDQRAVPMGHRSGTRASGRHGRYPSRRWREGHAQNRPGAIDRAGMGLRSCALLDRSDMAFELIPRNKFYNKIRSANENILGPASPSPQLHPPASSDGPAPRETPTARKIVSRPPRAHGPECRECQ
jgi:hypothetical protein